ncbi:MAG TPA: hypothetical protein VE553_03895 [Candidatus Binatia bacterium]|jgi:hypothetical protein|nr:hypothetical protein [Candidatus Binatia bacterium]
MTKLIALLTHLRPRFQQLQWVVPAGLILLAVAYEMGPVHWIHGHLGYSYHILGDIFFFGAVGPALAFLSLHILDRWLDERDTSDWQAQLLAQARAEAKECRELNDEALQVLFSAGALVDILQEEQPELSPEMIAQIEATKQALDQSVQHLRAHLLQEVQKSTEE